MNFEGVFVANITPFASSGEVDLESLESHLTHLASSGAHGFVPCGTTGESPTLSDREWELVIETTYGVAKKHDIKTIAGCSGNATEKVLKKISYAKKIGCDGALVITPYYNKPTERGMIEHFHYLADEGDLPIILYNIPPRTNINLTPQCISSLFEHKRIVGIKEGSGLHDQWLQIAEQNDLSKVSLLAGDDAIFATILALGGKGIISTTANIAPKEFLKIYHAAKENRWPDAFSLQLRLNKLIRALFLETNPAPVKQALKYCKSMNPSVRQPLIHTTDETNNALKKALKSLELNT